jgi:uncharacterized membrane protein
MEVGMYPLWLYLHIMGAIVAFGFGFAVPVIGRMAAAEPQHASFFLRAGRRVSSTVIIPAALSMAVTGGLLVMTSGHGFAELWLDVAIVLYVIAIGLSLFVQRPAFDRVIELTSTPPGPGGPSPEIPMLAARGRRTGYVLALLVLVIVGLMVFKPF